jgi:hypothetical protein
VYLGTAMNKNKRLPIEHGVRGAIRVYARRLGVLGRVLAWNLFLGASGPSLKLFEQLCLVGMLWYAKSDMDA